MCVLSCFSHIQLFETLQTIVHRLLCPWDSPRQEYWSGLPFSSPGDFPKPGIQLPSLMSPALAEGFFTHQCHLGSPIYNDIYIFIYCKKKIVGKLITKKKMAPIVLAGTSQKHPVPYDIVFLCFSTFYFKIWVNSILLVKFFFCYLL